MKKFTFFFLFTFAAALVYGQQSPPAAPDEGELPPGKAPVLIREEVDKRQPEPPSREPARAAEELQVGDFYFKRDNFPAAVARYREALFHRPDYVLAYEKLIRALEKNKETAEAGKLMQEYIEKFPGQKKTSEYARALAGRDRN
ncbi:MAG: hypothetical protein HYX74_04960 [Acidobacteria bacterium]|nr:hypothetical protein [Acidobacteriota bacterium]